MGFEVVVTQIVMLGLTMLIGFVAVKLHYLKASLKDALSSVIMRVTFPCMVITSLTKNDLSGPLLMNAGIVFVAALASMLTLYTVQFLLGKAFRLRGSNLRLHAMSGTFGNIGFLGYPLIQSLFGDTGLFYAVIYGLAGDTLVWTFGILQLRSETDDPDKKGGVEWKNLINPGTIVFVLSFCLMIFHIKIPTILYDTLSNVGSLTTYLSMLFIGMLLAEINLKGIYKRVGLYGLAAVKMVLFPVALMFVLHAIGVDSLVAAVVVLQVAMPSMTLITIIANEYHADAKYCAEAVFVTTILSLATLPLIYGLLSRLG